ncbi:ATP-NAD kinase-like domain-containing protein [Dichomitus squalens]|uniref:ATP-NAD kinase-like domain-containing protein n=1 Tax=Dichomitus squalens TaxID=114155 RepID=A0A4Q9QER6_9APHY|nr:ATP-NAD kinase-like domain-containing protein [Dichomitus squalens]TBU65746.1 ATP-NAD kinase-like domain-containing protein [Dichomitus squalens]
MASHSLHLGSGTNTSKFTLTEKELVLEQPANKKWPLVRTSLRNVLWAGIDDGNRLQISVLATKKRKSPLSLVHVAGVVPDADIDSAAAFTSSVMHSAYYGLTPRRRLKVIVNPKSGPGKGAKHFRKRVEPIFRAARCHVAVTFTSRARHAQEIAQALPLDDFDAVVVLSGDGSIYEVFNGFAAHADPARAFRMPVTPVPTGSGNGSSNNLLGREAAKDLAMAALNAIKGHPMSIDLVSILQNGKRTISFMTSCLGVMANLDLGTEHLRFMGSQRFVVGFLREVIKHRSYPYRVSIKVAESDKYKMVETLDAVRAHAQAVHGTAASPYNASAAPTSKGLPELKHIGPGADVDGDGWITFAKPVMYVYAGKGPFVSKDLMQFPVSHPDDGLIDVVISERTTRLAMIKGMDGSERGEQYWMDIQHYFKAYAYRVEPLAPKGYLSIDGEAYPHETFEAEVHQGLGTFLSMYGHYMNDFSLPPDRK